MREAPKPFTASAFERALRRRILSWGPERDGDWLARLRDEVEQTLAARQ
jgi:hypothetical protein